MSRGFWKHEYAMDLYMLVLKVQFKSNQYSKLKVEWFVRGHSLNIKQNIKIHKEDYRKWLPI